MRKPLPHPSDYIDQEHAEVIRRYSGQAEQDGQLHPEQMKIIQRLGWFKLLVPWTYGGLERGIPQLVRLQEGISWADGSAGWVVTLCGGAGWFGGFMSPQTAHQIFNTPGVCLAGSGATTGQAEITADGYRINGIWNYASGANHATHFTVNCLIKRGGAAVLDENGEPWVLPFVVDKKDVTLKPTWKTMGMVATGSHSFIIEDLVVSEDRCFHINPDYAEVNEDLYQYPFLQLAEATLAVNMSGMAMHFIDLCKELFDDKKRNPRLLVENMLLLDDLIDDTTALMNATRELFYKSVDISWEKPVTNRGCELNTVSKSSRTLAKISREVVDTLYPYCGLRAAATDSEINRVWRDMHTAGQHAIFTFER